MKKFIKNSGLLKSNTILSTRPEERVGSDEDWDKAEASLSEALDSNKLFNILEGEGAFYGPKIEFTLEDFLVTSSTNVFHSLQELH